MKYPISLYKKLCEILTDRDAVDILIKGLGTSIPEFRIEIAKILEDIGDTKAIEPLFKIFQEENKLSTKVSIAKSLGKLGDERALEFFIQILEDKSVKITNRQVAAGALGYIGNKKAVSPLLDTLTSLPENHKLGSLKQLIIESLGKLGQEI
ncbi:MAG: HEAT repeat domain-containing protein [Candidatus Heimdallarchaeota archaeon]|nr:HEAT repeat domain-containing protein [Candidatus Heimdallarchaeota archaeon]MCK4253844.1 HEAT repeat domain-containing protein [Candidatus Heimdallarchaeota archaeon]